MEFIDLKSQYSRIQQNINNRINTVLEHGKYILGPEVQELEECLADFVGVKHCIGVSSGTDALLIALMALEIKQGDEVITSPFSFISTAEVIALIGATPVFVDIEPRTYNIDPSKIRDAITDKTKAIMPVSLYGQCAEFDEINNIASQFNLPVIEDAAQSFGATYKGKKSCSLSLVGTTSFFPSKPLGAYGDAGAIFTNSEELATSMKQIRTHGQDRRYHHAKIGLNGRLDTIQAAVLLAKMEIFPQEIEARNTIANNYAHLLTSNVILPYIEPYNISVYAQYTIKINNRDKIISEMNKFDIPIAVHYPIPLNEQPVFMKYNSFAPIAKETSNKVLSLPMHPYLTHISQEQVSNVVLKYVR